MTFGFLAADFQKAQNMVGDRGGIAVILGAIFTLSCSYAFLYFYDYLFLISRFI